MHKLGYSDFTNDFLIKNFNSININITRNSSEVVAITGYDNNQQITNIPEEILQQVKQDINESNI